MCYWTGTQGIVGAQQTSFLVLLIRRLLICTSSNDGWLYSKFELKKYFGMEENTNEEEESEPQITSLEPSERKLVHRLRFKRRLQKVKQ